MHKLKQFQIHLVRHLKGQLDRVLLIINTALLLTGILLILFVKRITDDLYFIYNIEPWALGMDLYRFATLLIIFALRNVSVTKLITAIGFRVIFYLLINNFYDRFYGITDWSTNDTITVLLIGVEAILHALGIGKKKSPNI